MNGQQNVEDRSVLLTDVGFSYRDGELTLRDISLDIRKPQLVSIISLWSYYPTVVGPYGCVESGKDSALVAMWKASADM